MKALLLLPLLALTALGQTYPPGTTPYTRYFLGATNAADAVLRLELDGADFADITVTNITVVTQLHAKNAVITNLYFLAARAELATWSGGPTGVFNFASGSVQTYDSWTAFSITSVVGASNNYGNPGLLIVTNKSTTNFSFTKPSGWFMGRSDATAVTNGGIMMVWLYEANGKKTIATKEYFQ